MYQHLFDGYGGSIADARWSEILLQHDIHPSGHLGQEEVFACLVQRRLLAIIPSFLLTQSEARRWWPRRRGVSTTCRRERGETSRRRSERAERRREHRSWTASSHEHRQRLRRCHYVVARGRVGEELIECTESVEQRRRLMLDINRLAMIG
jgi:hypothetical protein